MTEPNTTPANNSRAGQAARASPRRPGVAAAASSRRPSRSATVSRPGPAHPGRLRELPETQQARLPRNAIMPVPLAIDLLPPSTIWTAPSPPPARPARTARSSRAWPWCKPVARHPAPPRHHAALRPGTSRSIPTCTRPSCSSRARTTADDGPAGAGTGLHDPRSRTAAGASDRSSCAPANLNNAAGGLTR